ncbi:hypothetical protein L249_0148, partial [Ophiocordyceps polyrhachis-furcata BCC 54312]
MRDWNESVQEREADERWKREREEKEREALPGKGVEDCMYVPDDLHQRTNTEAGYREGGGGEGLWIPGWHRHQGSAVRPAADPLSPSSDITTKRRLRATLWQRRCVYPHVSKTNNGDRSQASLRMGGGASPHFTMASGASQRRRV